MTVTDGAHEVLTVETRLFLIQESARKTVVWLTLFTVIYSF